MLHRFDCSIHPCRGLRPLSNEFDARATTMKRIGVFGGSFDPPHLAHLALVQAALAELPLDELRVVPTGQAWHKSRPLTPAYHRLAMAQLAFADLPLVVIDPTETPVSYTHLTLPTIYSV